MTDEQLFNLACVQITLEGERDEEGNLTIAGQPYEAFPETITVHGQRWRLIDEEEHEVEEEGEEFTAVRAFYDADSDEESDTKCPKCGEELDKCCGTGDPRCPVCDGPCPNHHDGPGPGEDDPTCPECEGELDEDGFCPEHGGPV